MAFTLKVATKRSASDGRFISESPANVLRGLESTIYLRLAKNDFVDQSDVDAYVTARAGVVGDWLVLDLAAAGVK